MSRIVGFWIACGWLAWLLVLGGFQIKTSPKQKCFWCKSSGGQLWLGCRKSTISCPPKASFSPTRSAKFYQADQKASFTNQDTSIGYTS